MSGDLFGSAVIILARRKGDSSILCQVDMEQALAVARPALSKKNYRA